MKDDGKIYIIVTDKLPAGGNTPTPGDKKKTEKKSDEEMLEHWARNRLLSEVKQLATTAVNYSISNIGNFTGDYIAQTHINDALRSVRGFVSIATSTAAGFKVGGPWGAVIGFSLGLVSESVSSAMQIHSNRVETNKVNYEIAQLRQRVGLNTTLDGSRGTQN